MKTLRTIFAILLFPALCIAGSGEFRPNNSGRNFKRTASGAGSYAALTTDYIIAKTGITGGGDTISLPAAATAGTGKVYIIKDESGTAATNNIVINPNGSELIDGLLTFSIDADFGAIELYTNGTAWFVY